MAMRLASREQSEHLLAGTNYFTFRQHIAFNDCLPDYLLLDAQLLLYCFLFVSCYFASVSNNFFET